jgi:alpha-L-arabinofuranosidase
MRIIVNANTEKDKISKHIYGHFAEHLGRCIYGGIWVGENSEIDNINGYRKDVVEALKHLRIPNLRWPGGCFADSYHWMDGIGPKEERPGTLNSHWGSVLENNHFGTHEFMEFCELIGTEPYICGNVGSGTVLEMQQWVEYITFDGQSPMADLRRKNGREKPWKLKFFGVGNENWGCGGNMRPEYYADLYKRYATYVRSFGVNSIYMVAGGANEADYHWTEVLMREAGHMMQGLSVHYYSAAGDFWHEKGSSTDFGEDGWFKTFKRSLFMDELISRHCTIMDKYDPDKKVDLIVDEWGTWYNPEPGMNPAFLYQKNTLRDALVAGVHFNIFNNHCDRVKVANIAQMVNVLQSIILTEGNQIILTPTYFAFELYKVHQDSQLLDIDFESPDYQFEGEKLPQISVSSSKDREGVIHISICNISPNDDADICLDIQGTTPKTVKAEILTAQKMNAQNSYDGNNQVEIKRYPDVKLESSQIQFKMPSKSIVMLHVY